MGGRLYDIQPDREPIDYTHWDCWDNNPFDIHLDQVLIAEELRKVVACWEETTGGEIAEFVTEMFDDYREAVFMLGFNTLLDMIVFNILRAGYDVYYGDEFIEIYNKTDWE